MRFLKLFFHYLGVPFVCVSFLWKYWRIKGKYRKYKNNPDSYPLEERYYAVYKLIKRFMYIKNYQVYTTGFDKIPSTPCLYIVNHKSSFDPLVLFMQLYENRKIPYFRFISKIEGNNKSRISCAMKLIDTIYIDRSDVRATYQIYNELNPIKDKRSIVLFIEGTRVYEPNKLGDFHAGSLQIAQRNFVPIVPFVMWGTSGALSGDTNRKFKNKRHQIFVNCLDKYNPSQFQTLSSVHLAEELNTKMSKELVRIDEVVNKQKKKYVDDPTLVFEQLDSESEEKRY